MGLSAMAFGLSGTVESQMYTTPDRSFTMCIPYKNEMKGISDKSMNGLSEWVEFKYSGDMGDYSPHYGVVFYPAPYTLPLESFYNNSQGAISDKINYMQSGEPGVMYTAAPAKTMTIGTHQAYQVTVSMKWKNAPENTYHMVFTSIYFPEKHYALLAMYVQTITPNAIPVPWSDYDAFMHSIQPTEASGVSDSKRCG